MIYFITDGEYLKIGKATDLMSRFQALQCGNPKNLYIVATVDGDYTEETELHKKFKHLRYKREWFYFTNELKEFIFNLEEMDATVQATLEAINLFNNTLNTKQQKALLPIYKNKLTGFYYKYNCELNKVEFSIPIKFLNQKHYK